MEGSQELIAVQAIATPIVLAIVQGMKSAGITSSRWAMPAAVALGIAVCWLIAFTDLVDGYRFRDDWAVGILCGVMVGLASAGLYSGVRRVAGAG